MVTRILKNISSLGADPHATTVIILCLLSLGTAVLDSVTSVM